MDNAIRFTIKFNPVPPYGGHRDLWLEIPHWDISRCYDSYYFALADGPPLPDNVRADSLEATKYKLLHYLNSWPKRLDRLQTSEMLFFHVGLWDECTEGLMIRKTDIDIFELNLGTILKGGHWIDPLRLDMFDPREAKTVAGRAPLQVTYGDLIATIETSVTAINHTVIIVSDYN
ncbi:MAG: hypothetical protein ACKV1O_05425 [Saprospiraceae bacterium]